MNIKELKESISEMHGSMPVYLLLNNGKLINVKIEKLVIEGKIVAYLILLDNNELKG